MVENPGLTNGSDRVMAKTNTALVKIVRRRQARKTGRPQDGWLMAVTTVGEQLERARDGHVTKWLVDGIIVEGGSTMIHARYGHGKSLAAIDLALAAVEGRPWLNAFPIAQQPVLYVDEDGNNDSEINSRLLSFQASDSAPLYFHLHKGFKIVNKRYRDEMIHWCQSKDVKLAIFDSFVRLHNSTEKSEDGMKLVNLAIKDFTMAGISVVMLHHSNNKGLIRGSSEIGAGCDSIYKMQKLDDNTFQITNDKARSVGVNGVWPGCTIVVSADEATGRLVLDGNHPLQSGDGDSAVLSPAAKLALKRDALRAGVLTLLEQEEEMTESAMSSALGNSSRDKDLFKEVLAELESEGEISCEKRGKGRFFRRLESESEIVEEVDDWDGTL